MSTLQLKKKIPAIALREQRSVEIKLLDLVSALALRWQVFNDTHLQHLGVMANLALVGSDGHDQAMHEYLEKEVIPLLRSLQLVSSYMGTPSAAERLLEFYRRQEQFWAGQTGKRWIEANQEVMAFYEEVDSARRQNA